MERCLPAFAPGKSGAWQNCAITTVWTISFLLFFICFIRVHIIQTCRTNQGNGWNEDKCSLYSLQRHTKMGDLKDWILLTSFFPLAFLLLLCFPSHSMKKLISFVTIFGGGFFCLLDFYVWTGNMSAHSSEFPHRQLPPTSIKSFSPATWIFPDAICCSDQSTIMLSLWNCLWQTLLLSQKQSLSFDSCEILTRFLQTLFSFPSDIVEVKPNQISPSLLQHLTPLTCWELLFKTQLSPFLTSSFE